MTTLQKEEGVVSVTNDRLYCAGLPILFSNVYSNIRFIPDYDAINLKPKPKIKCNATKIWTRKKEFKLAIQLIRIYKVSTFQVFLMFHSKFRLKPLQCIKQSANLYYITLYTCHFFLSFFLLMNVRNLLIWNFSDFYLTLIWAPKNGVKIPNGTQCKP